MSRPCAARVNGVVRVRMECDQCRRHEWVEVPLTDCGQCPEWEVLKMESNTWERQDDAITCSDECARKFWEDVW